MPNQPADRFNELSHYILKSLETLSQSVKELQSSLTELQVSLASRSDLEKLRDHCDSEFQKQRDRWEAEARDLRSSIVALQVKTAGIAALVGAAMSILIHKLGG